MIPVMLFMLLGLMSICVYLNKELALTNATSISGEYLSLNRGAASDPCAATISAFQNVAPFLSTNSATFTFKLNGVSYPAGTTSCTSGAANLVQGSPAILTVQYPCSLVTFLRDLMPNCQLTSQITEIVQ
jgi:hypothetical protein